MDKEKLIELILACNRKLRQESPYKTGLERVTAIADYLIANGVIVPPCKIGDTVYYLGGLYSRLIKSARVEEIIVNSIGVSDLLVASENGVVFENSINYFYFTREEAEKALAEREGADYEENEKA